MRQSPPPLSKIKTKMVKLDFELFRFEPGQELPLHKHKPPEIYYILKVRFLQIFPDLKLYKCNHIKPL